ncbi:MAG TPA: hypothetical protein VNV18_08135 [Stellaceae bacterium]|jgi:hypothetical protein|nr:hypothetical protein [Stellaceae bacterium]
MRYRTVFLVAAGLALVSGGAQAATAQATSAMQHWKTMDTCAKQAQAAFPDYTPDSNAKRDARLKDCLNANNLPPREPSTPGQ